MKKLQVVLLLIYFRANAQCPPTFTVSYLTNTFTCNNPTVLLTASCNDLNTKINWQQAAIPPVIESSTIIVPSPMGVINPPPVPPIINHNYTVVVTNTLLSCSASSVFTFYENYRPPFTKISVVNPPATLCQQPVVLSSAGSSVTNWVVGAGIKVVTWEYESGFTPSLTTLYTQVAGVHTLTIEDDNNGCRSSSTVMVNDNRPSLTFTALPTTNTQSCDAKIAIDTKGINAYSLSSTSGLISSDTIKGLCYGKVKFCLKDLSSNCFRCDSVTIDQYTSINEMSMSDDVLIYANDPITCLSILNQGNSMVKVLVRDINGVLIKSIELGPGIFKRERIYPSGLYIIETVGPASLRRKKVLISD